MNSFIDDYERYKQTANIATEIGVIMTVKDRKIHVEWGSGESIGAFVDVDSVYNFICGVRHGRNHNDQNQKQEV